MDKLKCQIKWKLPANIGLLRAHSSARNFNLCMIVGPYFVILIFQHEECMKLSPSISNDHHPKNIFNSCTTKTILQDFNPQMLKQSQIYKRNWGKICFTKLRWEFNTYKWLYQCALESKFDLNKWPSSYYSNINDLNEKSAITGRVKDDSWHTQIQTGPHCTCHIIMGDYRNCNFVAVSERQSNTKRSISGQTDEQQRG